MDRFLFKIDSQKKFPSIYRCIGVKNKKPFYSMIYKEFTAIFRRKGGVKRFFYPGIIFFTPWKISKKHKKTNLSHGIKTTVVFYESHIFNILISVLFDFLIVIILFINFPWSVKKIIPGIKCPLIK